MPETRRARVATVASLFLLLGLTSTRCGVSAQAAPPTVLEALPTLRYREDLRLGSENDPDPGFSQIAGVAVDRDSAIYVADYMTRTIHVFDRKGGPLLAIGRQGDGPGEFGAISRFGVTGDTVWVVDLALRRLTLFDSAGDVLSTGRMQVLQVPLRDQRWNGVVIPFALRSDGFFTGRMQGYTRRTAAGFNGVGPRDNVWTPVVRFDPRGAVVDTLSREPYLPPTEQSPKSVDLASGSYRVPLPPTGDPLTVNLAETRWVVDGGVPQSSRTAYFRVVRLDDRGDTIFARSYAYAPRRYTNEILDSIAFTGRPRSNTIAFGGPPPRPDRRELRVIQRAIRDAMEYPRWQPPVQEAVGGDDGTLWLRREDRGDANFQWLVLGPTGTPIGVVDLPRHWRLHRVDAGGFFAEAPDAFDVPWVIRCRLQKPRESLDLPRGRLGAMWEGTF